MKIIKYKQFKTSKDFEKWQKSFPECMITNVVPALNKLESNEAMSQVSSTTTWGIFVTYIEAVETDFDNIISMLEVGGNDDALVLLDKIVEARNG